jgi:predicted nucleotidyltransferase component of viral defense system
VIPHAEILALRDEWGLRDDVVEKDYALGWLLGAIASQPELSSRWVFKGGTCLRKCFYETYRFSEDLDFTVVDGGPETADELLPVMRRAAAWLRERTGIELEIDPSMFRPGQNRRGKPIMTIRVGYRGPRNPPNVPKVKIDLTSDEVLASPTDTRSILHPYSDSGDLTVEVATYGIVELLAEKIRALVERCRPRDLYDVINVYRHPELIESPADVREALKVKCEHAAVPVPDAAAIHSSPFRKELEQEWANMLAHQLPHLPAISEYWSAVEAMFEWLNGASRKALRRIEPREKVDTTWAPPRSMAAWGGGRLDLLRYAGSNRLKVDIDYRAERGRQGWRRVEPYAFRRTQDGHTIAVVVNDRGQTRSYRTDRMIGLRVSDEPFIPKYLVEF